MRHLALILCALWVLPLRAQTHFELRFDTLTLPGLPGLHSFVYAKNDDKWLLIGGRRDGMHPKFGGFQTSSANQQLYVVDPATQQVWQRSLSGLPDTLQEQLRSANAEFFQSGNTLCVVGGYGRSEVAQNHITYPYLTLIDVPAVVSAVVGNSDLTPHFQQIRDTFFAVAGGQLQQLADTFYLVGGHRFEGVYSANSGGNVVQQYTNAIRKFTLTTTDNGWVVAHQSQVVDELLLHRRDYNLAPQIFANGEVGLAAFAGVFQPGLALLPFLNIAEIRPSGGHAPVNGFSQFLANYHCAKAPIYSPAHQEMHTLFFGGMSQYALNDNDSLIRDNRIPFVKTASRVTRLADGTYEEVAFDHDLPFYTGTSAELILADGLPLLGNDIVNYDPLPDGETLLGHIVGGIVTPENQTNPFLANSSGVTAASNRLIQVFLVKNPPNNTVEHFLDGRFQLHLEVYPNPTGDQWTARLQLPRAGDLHLVLQNAQGKIVRRLHPGTQAAGEVVWSVPASDLPAGPYWLTANVSGVFVETKVVFKN